MDFGMPYAQKQAWNNVKEALDNYVELTGSDIAVVTKFKKASQLPGAGDGPTSDESFLALHGHGNLLLRVKQCLDQIKKELDVRNGSEDRIHASRTIPVPLKVDDYHSQSVARSLTSTFQSLKLEGHPTGHGHILHQQGNRRLDSGKRRPHIAPSNNRDLAELNENLLFEDDADQEDDYRESSDSELDDDFELEDYPVHNRNMMIARNPITQQSIDPSRAGTSLPVNINMNYRPIVKQDAKPQISHMKFPGTTSRPQNFPEDTPNPSKMMASMQALARSVTGDTAQIFGDRPRPSVTSNKHI